MYEENTSSIAMLFKAFKMHQYFERSSNENEKKQQTYGYYNPIRFYACKTRLRYFELCRSCIKWVIYL